MSGKNTAVFGIFADRLAVAMGHGTRSVTPRATRNAAPGAAHPGS